MVSLKSFRGSVLVLGLAVVLTFTIRASSQTPSLAEDPIRALLAEVHALRLAMEQQATINPRIQLSMARLNIEEQRTSRLTQDLDQVRTQLASATASSQMLGERIPELEKSMLNERDENKRTEFEELLRQAKLQQTEASLHEQQLRARDLELSRSLDTEQARWIELNNRIDELERLLAPAPKPQ